MINYLKYESKTIEWKKNALKQKKKKSKICINMQTKISKLALSQH
jgi:hypothetical protein